MRAKYAIIAAMVAALALCLLGGCPQGIPDVEVSSFTFAAADNSGLAADITATVSGTMITAAVPAGTDVTALVPTIVLSAEGTLSRTPAWRRTSPPL